MDEVLGLLCGLTVFLAVVAVVGHGIWMAVAAAIRWLSGSGIAERQETVLCPACRTRLWPGTARCYRCDHQLVPDAVTSRRGDQAATLRHLQRLCERGWLESASYEELVAVVRKAGVEVPPAPDAGRIDRAPGTREEDQAPARVPPPVAGTYPIGVQEDEIVDAVVLVEPTPSAAFRPRTPRAVPPAAPPAAERAESSGSTAPPPIHPLDRDYVERPAAVSAARRQLAAVLQAFMAEKNIRWGELIAGLLIVGSAVGLVISLRATLTETIPYFPALIFMLITLAIYGAGMYTLRRWNLQATSRGVLTISLLLTPLNFLAAVIMSGPEDRPVTHPVYLLAVAVGLLAGGWITFSAGRAVVARGWWRLTSAVLATSVGVLLIDRLARPGASLGGISLLAAVPLGGFLVATVSQINGALPWWQLSGRRAQQLFQVLGISLFALAAPLGLLISKSGPLRDSIAQLGPASGLVAAVILATGLLAHRRIVQPRLAAMRTAGTALAVCGGMLMTAAVVFAWPKPDLLIAVGLTNGVMLVWLAVRGGLPILHAAAIGCLALASLVAFHAHQGNLVETGAEPGRRLLDALLMGRSSIVLTALALISAAVSSGLIRIRRSQDAHGCLLGATGIGTASVFVALWAGFGPGGDRDLATPVFAFYAVASIVAAALVTRSAATSAEWKGGARREEGGEREAEEQGWRSGRMNSGLLGIPSDAPVVRPEILAPLLTWAGSVLMLVTFVHGLWQNSWMVAWLDEQLWLPRRPLLTAAVLHADLCALLAVFFAGRQNWAGGTRMRDVRWRALVDPLAWSAMAVATFALPFSLWAREQAFGLHAAHLFASAAVWLAVAVLYRNDPLAAVFHAVATVAVGFLVAAHCRAQSWGENWWTDPRHLQYQVAVVSAWCAAWSVGRRLAGRRDEARQLLGLQWLTVQEAVLAIGLAGMVILGLATCMPGVAAELGMTSLFADDAAGPASYVAGAWFCLALVLTALLAQLWNRWAPEGVVALLLAAAVIPLLVAAPWTGVGAAASAVRWSFAGYGLAAAVGGWFRAPIRSLVSRIGWLGEDDLPPRWSGLTRELSLLLGGLPIVLLTAIVAGRRLSGLAVGTPDADSLFGQMSTAVSFAVPLLVLVTVLVGHAIREKNMAYALAGSALLQFATCLACALEIPPDSPEFLASLLQWNSVSLGGYAVVWLALQRWMCPAIDSNTATVKPFRDEPWPLKIQLAATCALLIVLAVWAAVTVFVTPDRLPQDIQPLGSPLSYLAWGLAVGAGWRFARGWGFEERALLAGGLGGALVAFLALTIDGYDVSRTWKAYHVLMYGFLAVATGWTVTARRRPQLARAAATLCWIAAVLAVRGTTADPHPLAPWWSVGAAAGAAGLVAVLALAHRSQPFAYGSMLLTGLAASVGVIGYHDAFFPGAARVFTDLVQVNLIAVSAAGAFWLGIDIWYQRRSADRALDPEVGPPSVHVGAAILAVIAAAVFFAGSLVLNGIERTVSGRNVLDATDLGGILALSVLGTLLIGSLWEQRRGYGVPCLYVWGALVTVAALDMAGVKGFLAFWSFGMAAGGYATLTGLIWRQGVYVAALGSRWHVCDPVAGLRRTAVWLPTVNLLVAASATLATLIVVSFFPDRWMRISSGMVPAVLAVGLAALAQQERRALLQYVSLLMTGVAAVCLSWADLPPEWSERLILLRLIRALIALAGLTFVYGVIVVRRVPGDSRWRASVQRIALTFGGAAGLVLLAVLLVERLYYVPGVGAPVDTAPMAAVAVVLVGLVIGLVSLALLPGRGPVSLTERQRRACVYGAELVAALIFAHLFMCRPTLFGGFLRPYWPYLVMAIAFAGVGVGELFQRSGIRVLSDPLQRTSAFLPLIPALGFWVVAAEKSDYSLVLFAAGLVYLLLSMFRRSIASGLAALVAGNAALWSLLTDTGFAFWQHPQFWLVPPAGSALIAGQINRTRLQPAQLAALRYASILVIYLSSSGEVFLRGVGESLWPPMILAALSVAGVLAGIVLQIRAFLYLGTSFVLLSVVTMVWHAARAIQHVWPWWAFGIGLGICILVLFGLFEKKRPEITAWIGQLQQWEQ